MPADLPSDVEVLVLKENGDRIGEMKARQALALASEQHLDLVVISRQGSLIVCKIIDEGKWRYQQKKKQKRNTKKTPPLKEIKFSIATEQHDIDTKMKHIREFISKGCTVKISVEMYGREKEYSGLAKDKLESIIKSLGSSVHPGCVTVTPHCVFTKIQPARL